MHFLRAAGVSSPGSGGRSLSCTPRYGEGMVASSSRACFACCAMLVLGGCAEVTLDSIAPDLVAAGTSTEVTIRGAGFAPGIRFSLTAGALEVNLSPVRFVDEGSAEARVPAAAPAGRYDLVARTSGGEAILEDALEIFGGELVATFLDVGQGDASAFESPSGELLLIDGGRGGAASASVIALLEERGVHTPDAVILSHFDADHLGGLVEVLAGTDGLPGTNDDLLPPVTLGPADDGTCDTQVCGRMRQLRAWPFDVVSPGYRFYLGEVEVEVVAADGVVGDDLVAGAGDDNERSIAVLVSFAGRRVLVAGDLTGGGEGTADLETPLSALTGPVDVLRTGHHGSKTSSNDNALSTWAPIVAVVSAGTDNPYCHPAEEVLVRSATHAREVFVTGKGIVDDGDRCGGATLATDNVHLGMGNITIGMTAAGELLLPMARP